MNPITLFNEALTHLARPLKQTVIFIHDIIEEESTYSKITTSVDPHICRSRDLMILDPSVSSFFNNAEKVDTEIQAAPYRVLGIQKLSKEMKTVWTSSFGSLLRIEDQESLEVIDGLFTGVNRINNMNEFLHSVGLLGSLLKCQFLIFDHDQGQFFLVNSDCKYPGVILFGVRTYYMGDADNRVMKDYFCSEYGSEAGISKMVKRSVIPMDKAPNFAVIGAILPEIAVDLICYRQKQWEMTPLPKIKLNKDMGMRVIEVMTTKYVRSTSGGDIDDNDLFDEDEWISNSTLSLPVRVSAKYKEQRKISPLVSKVNKDFKNLEISSEQRLGLHVQINNIRHDDNQPKGVKCRFGVRVKNFLRKKAQAHNFPYSVYAPNSLIFDIKTSSSSLIRVVEFKKYAIFTYLTFHNRRVNGVIHFYVEPFHIQTALRPCIYFDIESQKWYSKDIFNKFFEQVNQEGREYQVLRRVLFYGEGMLEKVIDEVNEITLHKPISTLWIDYFDLSSVNPDMRTKIDPSTLAACWPSLTAKCWREDKVEVETEDLVGSFSIKCTALSPTEYWHIAKNSDRMLMPCGKPIDNGSHAGCTHRCAFRLLGSLNDYGEENIPQIKIDGDTVDDRLSLPTCPECLRAYNSPVFSYLCSRFGCPGTMHFDNDFRKVVRVKGEICNETLSEISGKQEIKYYLSTSDSKAISEINQNPIPRVQLGGTPFLTQQIKKALNMVSGSSSESSSLAIPKASKTSIPNLSLEHAPPSTPEIKESSNMMAGISSPSSDSTNLKSTCVSFVSDRHPEIVKLEESKIIPKVHQSWADMSDEMESDTEEDESSELSFIQNLPTRSSKKKDA